jgi:hypothetical protein
MKLFIVKIEYEDGWSTVLPHVEAEDYAVVSETILHEHGDQMPAIKKIIVKEKHGTAS